MKKLVTGFNEAKQEEYNNNLALKQRLGKEALSYASEFVSIENIDLFLDDMTATFNRLFMEQTKGDFSPRIIMEKRFEQVGFFAHKLSAYQNQYEGIQIELDKDLKPTDKVDFNTYLLGEENIRVYEAKQLFLEALYEYEKQGGKFQPAMIQRALPMQFNYDYATAKLTPTK